jgi:isoamylase
MVALRERQKRNLFASMLLSHGTPMLLAGDEFGHTQRGNNNAYAQENETTWLNWLGIDAPGRALREFVRKLIALRKAFPILTAGGS